MAKNKRPWTYFEIECPVEVEEKITTLLQTVSFPEVIRRAEAYEGLVEKLGQIRTCLLVLKNTKTEEGLKDLPEELCILYEEVERALRGEPK